MQTVTSGISAVTILHLHWPISGKAEGEQFLELVETVSRVGGHTVEGIFLIPGRLSGMRGLNENSSSLSGDWMARMVMDIISWTQFPFFLFLVGQENYLQVQKENSTVLTAMKRAWRGACWPGPCGMRVLILMVLGEGTLLLAASFPPIAEGSGRKQFCEHLRMCSKTRKLNRAESSRAFL